MTDLSLVDIFGDIAAEDDAVLEYFLSTDAAKSVASGKILMVLGRKGSGKTALVRHFTETDPKGHGRPLSLRNYPWLTHQGLIDKGASKNEAYVASWKLLIAIRLASMVCILGQNTYLDSLAALTKFLMSNFGTIDPDTGSIFAQSSLKTAGLTVAPTLAGFALGSITFSRDQGNKVLGVELNSLTTSIFKDVTTSVGELGIKKLFLHFDELDQGLDIIDGDRARILIGLILAAREISNSKDFKASIRPVVYLRTDIWDQLDFSDKNKITQTSSVHLIWTDRELKAMVNNRLSAKTGALTTWEDVEDHTKMRGSQPKWLHILSRTMLRPRDAIQFLNISLKIAKLRGATPLLFTSDDINASREAYSKYLKQELDDEIIPHWKEWTEALQACSRIQTITFKSEDFEPAYKALKSPENRKTNIEALEILFRFSVIGYERRLSKGGSSWLFKYADENAGWDPSAPRFKVHQGLKEFAKLKEERAS